MKIRDPMSHPVGEGAVPNDCHQAFEETQMYIDICICMHINTHFIYMCIDTRPKKVPEFRGCRYTCKRIYKRDLRFIKYIYIYKLTKETFCTVQKTEGAVPERPRALEVAPNPRHTIA